MIEPISTYFDHELQCEVKVYPSKDKPRRYSPKFKSQKQRDEERRERAKHQTQRMNAYDAAVAFDVQRDEAQSVPSVMTDFEVQLKQERARFNRRKAH